ncbi:MAG: M20/M25/M40 family metallo-hydrolase [Rhizomicrobium sp.]
MGEGRGAFARMVVLALAALAVWFVCSWANQPRSPWLNTSPPPTEFSSDRAGAVLARIAGPQRPHPVGVPENAAVRARILKEIAALKVPAKTYKAFTCNTWRGFLSVDCATVTDIIAVAIPGQGKTIVMMAHYDSVPGGPGVSDDLSGVATIIEAVRALKTSGATGKHPVVALFTEGEESGLLGAHAFLENPLLKARVGAVVNVEGRGTSGPSLLFQTSAGDSRLIDLYAANVPTYATSSLYAEIYKFLPNDTDLTLFLHAGFPAFNFAFADNVRYYHSPFDTLAHLSRATLQMHGDNVLGVVRGLMLTDFADLKRGNDVYISMLGRWLPRMPQAFALPLAILAFLAIALAAWLARDPRIARRGMLLSAFMPLVLLVGCAVIGFALAFLAQMISAQPDPTYAYPLAMRIALGFGVCGAMLFASRMAGIHGAATSAWLWMSGLAVTTGIFLPGLSPYFLFPSLVAAVLLLATARIRNGWSSEPGQVALFFSALVALLIWFALAIGGEGLMGLKLHPLFTIPVAFGLMTLVPLLASRPFPHRVWSSAVVLCLVLALALAVVAGLLPSYSAASPQRVNLIYFESGNRPARWIAETAWKANATEPLPKQLKDEVHFQYAPDAYSGWARASGHVAPAGAARYPLPTASVTSDRQDGASRIVSLLLHGSPNTSAMSLRIPKQAKLTALRIRGENLRLPAGWADDARIFCDGPDCRELAVTLTLANRTAIAIPFAERRYGLPDFGKAIAAARPPTAMPSQSGNGAILANTIRLLTK